MPVYLLFLLHNIVNEEYCSMKQSIQPLQKCRCNRPYLYSNVVATLIKVPLEYVHMIALMVVPWSICNSLIGTLLHWC